MIDELTMAVVVVDAAFENRRRKGQPTGHRQSEILMCAPGEPVELRPEPGNPADETAIAAYSARGVQLGYLSADKTAIVHRTVREARLPEAIFQAAASWGCWIRVGLGRAPTLPVAREPESERQPVCPGDEWDGIDDLPPEGW